MTQSLEGEGRKDTWAPSKTVNCLYNRYVFVDSFVVFLFIVFRMRYSKPKEATCSKIIVTVLSVKKLPTLSSERPFIITGK